MRDIKIFSHEMFGDIRTMTNESGETFFVGKDVATALGYKKPENAIATHVDDEDKSTTLIQGTAYETRAIIINESVTIKAMAVAPDMYESEVAEFSYIVEGTGIDNVTVNGQIQIYPLPVHDKVNISAGGKAIKSVTISSMNGVVVASANKPATTVTIDVSRIPTGIYIINVTTVDSTFSRKILKVE